jgi:hypothetical protein
MIVADHVDVGIVEMMATVTNVSLRNVHCTDAILLLSSAPRLRCVTVDRTIFDILDECGKESLFRLPKTLTELVVYDTTVSGRSFPQYHAMYQQFITLAPNLMILRFEHSETDAHRVQLTMKDGVPVALLCTIRMNITDSALTALLRFGWPLREIVIESTTGMGDSMMLRLAQQISALQVIKLGSPSLTDQALWALADHCPGLLEVAVDSGSAFTDSGVVRLAKECPQLRKLDLTYSQQCTEASIIALAAHCPQLEVINLAYCSLITDAAVKALVSGCPGLVYVSLNGCRLLTDAGVAALVQGCRSLHTLHIRDCRNLTDMTLAHLAQHSPKLRKLTVDIVANHEDGCTTGMSPAGQIAIESAIPALEIIVFLRHI